MGLLQIRGWHFQALMMHFNYMQIKLKLSKLVFLNPFSVVTPLKSMQNLKAPQSKM